MFLVLKHQKMDVYSFSRAFVLECYRLTKILPAEERFWNDLPNKESGIIGSFDYCGRGIKEIGGRKEKVL